MKKVINNLFIWKAKPISPVRLSFYPKRSKQEIRLIDKNPFGDRDKDRVPNIFDCKPLNRKRQGFLTTVTKKTQKRYKPQIESIARGIERRLVSYKEAAENIGQQISKEAEKKAEKIALRKLKRGESITEGVAVKQNPLLQAELQKLVQKSEGEYLGYHSAINILREKPNPLRKMIIVKQGGEKKVVGFTYEDPHVLARRMGLLPEVVEEAKKIEGDIARKEMGKNVQLPKSLELEPYTPKQLVLHTDISGKIGEAAAERVLRRKIPKEERGKQIELDTIYIVPEERGKGYAKKVVESLLKRPKLEKITGTAKKHLYEDVWSKAGAKAIDTTGTAEHIARLKAIEEKETPEEEKESLKKFKEEIVDVEWTKPKGGGIYEEGD